MWIKRAGNMSYSRFENTLDALRDCERAMNEEDENELSNSEKEAKKVLIELCKEIADTYAVTVDDEEE